MDWFLYDRDLFHERVNTSLHHWFCPKLFLVLSLHCKSFFIIFSVYKINNANLSRLCKGYTLYAHIHVHGTKFEDAKLISIIQQIAQVGFFCFNIWLRVCFFKITSVQITIEW